MAWGRLWTDIVCSFCVGTLTYLVWRVGVCAKHLAGWGGIFLVHLAEAFGRRRFGVFHVDCGMDGSYCLVHLESGRLGSHCSFGTGVLYPGVSSDFARHISVE